MLNGSPKQAPPPHGLKLKRTLQGHEDYVKRLAWSPDGLTLASSSADRTIRLWDARTGEHVQTLSGHLDTVYGIAWSPDGGTLASASGDHTVRLWNIKTGELKATLEGHTARVMDVAWSPSGWRLASCSDDETIRVWGGTNGQLLLNLKTDDEPRRGRVKRFLQSITWSPDGEYIVTSTYDGLIIFFSGNDGSWRNSYGVPQAAIYCVRYSPVENVVASSLSRGVIFLWSRTQAGKSVINVLEGHTRAVTGVSFSYDGRLLASKSRDGTVRIWHRHKRKTLTIIDEPHSKCATSGLDFHPSLPILATTGPDERYIRIWDISVKAISKAAAVVNTVHYSNAKVVLVGESGVGKTGLGTRLAEGNWRPTPGSTHGMNVWPLHSETEREVMLWDFAGQDEYRLVHQLFLNETNVALILYDPTRSQDTFQGIDYWEKALKNAVQGEVRKILVAARVDVGGVRMTAADIEAFCKAHGYAAHFATSAESGEGCEELRAAIIAAIPWESLPRTSSPEIFKRIKDFLAAVRQGNRVIVREHDLLAEFNSQAGNDAPTEAEFRTVIGHVETAGLIKRLSFGDFVLLKPELLNGYASDIVDAARRHRDGLGAVRKSDVLDARIRLKEEGGLISSDRIFLLHATVELFLRLGLALEQDGNLVFPSKFNRRMPPLEEDPVVEVEFSFEGPVENLYTTLVVKLYYGGVFKLKKLWKNAAEFLNGRGLVCGFQLQNEGEGQGTLKVFYAEGVRDDDKALFLKIVADHFREKCVEVRRQRIYRCPHCREMVRDRQAVTKALERGAKEMPCLYCFKTFPLMDALEVLYRDDEKFLSQIAEMESRAEASMERGGEFVSAAAELRTENFKNWAGGADVATVAIVFTDVLDSTALNVNFGDEPWRHVREAHFARARELVKSGNGYLIKTIGDSVMAAFHSAGDALDFALALRRNTGHESVKIRAGIHIGPVEVSAGDAFGQQVNMASRVEGKAKSEDKAEAGGVWVSAKVKEDVDILRSSKHKHLKWIEHPEQELKGFPDKCTLWSVEE